MSYFLEIHAVIRVEVFKEVEEPGGDDKYKSIEELWFLFKFHWEADKGHAH